MENNHSNHMDVNNEVIQFRKLQEFLSSVLEEDKMNRCDFVDIGNDQGYCITDESETKDVVNNNLDGSKIESLHEAMKLTCFSMFNMRQLVASNPRLETMCLDKKNHFFDSRYKSYRFYRGKDNELHGKVDDFKYLINISGSHLLFLNVEAYPFSDILPFIKTDCPNLVELTLQYVEIESQDFENVFSNMSYLEVLRIHWRCENSSLPLPLVKSLEQVGRTLKELCLSRDEKQNHLGLPDSLASVFPQLFYLEKLNIINFEPSQSIIQSISEMANLVHLKFMCSWVNNHSVFNEQISMYPIGNLINLETFFVNFDCGVTDKFLINLCTNAENLKCLDIIGKNIRDYGMMELDKLTQLESLKFNLIGSEKNKFITDRSTQYLTHKKLKYLHLSNCINITNKSLLEIFRNSPNLEALYVRNTNVTFDVTREILKLTKHYNKPVYIYVSFEDRDDMFKSLAQSGVFFKSNFNTRKYVDIII